MESAVKVDADAPIVEIPNLGKVRGCTSQTFWDKQKIYQFLRIKYGESPSGIKRFKKAEPAKPWEGIQDATKTGPKCVDDRNIHEFLEKNDNCDLEDCLYLSVYSKNLSGKAPVMLYIASSGYFDDKKEKEPNFLLEEDVVLVVPNYRTGLLGFFATGSKEIRGNAGFADIILVLEWVQNHIKHFGGDPTSVTVFGQGFGAALAHALLFSHQVPDHYFHKVILQSGSMLCSWATKDDLESEAKSISWFAGLKEFHGITEEVDKVILTAKIDDLLNEIWDSKYECNPYEPDNIALSTLTAGGYGNLPSNFINAERKCKPIMAGVNKNDGVFTFAKVYNILGNRIDTEYDKHNSYIMLDYIRDFMSIEDKTGFMVSFAAKEFFTQEQMIKGDFKEMIHGFIDFCGTTMFKAPVLRAVQLQAMLNPKNVFLYSFDYDGKVKDFESTIQTFELPCNCGVYHSYENTFLFPSVNNLKNMSKEDLQMARMMVKFWTSFAKNGVPSSENAINWPPLTEVSGPVYHIDNVPHVTKSFYDEFSATVKDAANGKILVKKD